jgi:ATP-binding cassette, subfamily G (WHITE), member 2, PDR
MVRLDYQKTVGNLALSMTSSLVDLVNNRKRKVQILNGLDGVLESGEMLVVLGPPGRYVPGAASALITGRN